MSIPKELIAEICAEENISYDEFSYGYLIRLTKGDKIKHIAVPYWDVNSAAAARIACDKAACYTLLTQKNIPAIEHELLFNPLRRSNWIDNYGTWQRALDYFNANGQKVVAKPNQGFQGLDVYYCDTPATLEHAIQTIFASAPDAALSPYYEIETEYRCYYIYGRCAYIYGKSKGDSWKHNLSEGATVFEVENEMLQSTLAQLACDAAKAIGISFATVDIVTLQSGPFPLAVMEVNAGVNAQLMLEQLPHRRDTIKSIYVEAVRGMFI